MPITKEKLSANFQKLSKFYWTRPHILTIVLPTLLIGSILLIKGLITGSIDPVDDIYYNHWIRLALFVLMNPSTWFPIIKILAINLLVVLATFGVTTLIIYFIIKKAFWNIIVPKLKHNEIVQGYVGAKINPPGWQYNGYMTTVRAFNRILGLKTIEKKREDRVELYFYRTWKQGVKAFFNPKSMKRFHGSTDCKASEVVTGIYSISITGRPFFKANKKRTIYTDSDTKIEAPSKQEISKLSETFDGIGNIVAKGTGLGLMSQAEIMKDVMEQQHFFNTEDIRNAEKEFLKRNWEDE